MSLYDDLDDVPKVKSDLWNAGLTPSINLMQPHISNRKAPKKGPTSILKSTVTNYDSKKNNSDGEFRFNHMTGKIEKSYSECNPDETILKLGIKDEYNPLYPNDYEQISKILETKRKIEQMKNECDQSQFENISRKIEPTEPVSNIIEKQSIPMYYVEDDTTPSTVNVENEEYYMPGDHHAKAVAATQAKYGTTSTAAKIMVKMGFQEGKGLGKEGQGMSSALKVEKTSGKQGKIIHEKDISLKNSFPAANIHMKLSNVVLLRNMVGPGEVDDELQPETAEECSKYGKVVSCNVFELQEVSDDQAVRIFVEFFDIPSAVRAVNDLNGRFFGGRIVSAAFYDSERFKNLELSDEPCNVNDFLN